MVELLIGELRTALRNYARKQPAGYLSNDRITLADLVFDAPNSLYTDPEFETTDRRPGSSAVDLICRSLQERRGVDGRLDDGTPDCDGFFLASLSPLHRETHRVMWPMALTTIRLLLDGPRRSPLALLRTTPQTAAALSAITTHPRPEAGPVYEAERQELAAFLRTTGL